MKKAILEIIIIIGIFLFRIYKPTILPADFGQPFLDIILSYISFVLVLTLGKNLLFYVYKKHKKIPLQSTDNIISGIDNIYWLIVGISSTFTGLSLLGIDVKGLFASLSFLAAAIAILSKDYISNVISGMLIAFSNDVNVGDYIKVGNNRGKVLSMSITMFSLLTDDDDIAIVPNNMVYNLDVLNYTKREIKKTSIEFEMSISAIQSPQELENELILVLQEYSGFIQPNSYNLKIVSIKKDLIEFKFQYILIQPDHELEKAIRKKAVRRVIQIIKSQVQVG